MNIVKKTTTGLVASLVLFVTKASLVKAQVTIPTVGNEDTPLLEGFVIPLLNTVVGIGAIVAAAVLIYNGFLYMTASGEESKVDKATKGITYAIVGLIIAAIAFMIVNFVIGLIADPQTME